MDKEKTESILIINETIEAMKRAISIREANEYGLSTWWTMLGNSFEKVARLLKEQGF